MEVGVGRSQHKFLVSQALSLTIEIDKTIKQVIATKFVEDYI